jgi:hypothetical protein
MLPMLLLQPLLLQAVVADALKSWLQPGLSTIQLLCAPHSCMQKATKRLEPRFAALNTQVFFGFSRTSTDAHDKHTNTVSVANHHFLQRLLQLLFTPGHSTL